MVPSLSVHYSHLRIVWGFHEYDALDDEHICNCYSVFRPYGRHYNYVSHHFGFSKSTVNFWHFQCVSLQIILKTKSEVITEHQSHHLEFSGQHHNCCAVAFFRHKYEVVRKIFYWKIKKTDSGRLRPPFNFGLFFFTGRYYRYPMSCTNYKATLVSSLNKFFT